MSQNLIAMLEKSVQNTGTHCCSHSLDTRLVHRSWFNIATPKWG